MPVHTGALLQVQTSICEGEDVTASSGGATPLHIAADFGHREACDALLAATGTARVNARCSQAKAPIYITANNSHLGVCNTLLAAGAKADALFGVGDGRIHFGASDGHREVRSAVLATGANVNAENARGCTALYNAAKNGHRELWCALLPAGVNVATARGDMALHIARRSDQVKMCSDRPLERWGRMPTLRFLLAAQSCTVQ